VLIALSLRGCWRAGGSANAASFFRSCHSWGRRIGDGRPGAWDDRDGLRCHALTLPDVPGCIRVFVPTPVNDFLAPSRDHPGHAGPQAQGLKTGASAPVWMKSKFDHDAPPLPFEAYQSQTTLNQKKRTAQAVLGVHCTQRATEHIPLTESSTCRIQQATLPHGCD